MASNVLIKHKPNLKQGAVIKRAQEYLIVSGKVRKDRSNGSHRGSSRCLVLCFEHHHQFDEAPSTMPLVNP